MGFRDVDRSRENYSLPKAVDDLIPDNHLAKFIVLIVNLFDLTPFTSKYKGNGKPAYLPSVLLSLLLYSYATGVTSTRVMERNTYEFTPYVYICGFQHPDHNTIARFRNRFRAEIEHLFPEFLEYLGDLGLLTSNTCRLDGAKVNVNASKRHVDSFGIAKERLAKLEEELKELSALDPNEFSNRNINIPDEITRRKEVIEQLTIALEEITKKARLRAGAKKEA